VRIILPFLALLCLAGPGVAAEPDADSPVVRLFDTGAPLAAPLDAKALAAKANWTAVPEDKTAHAFRGDAVVVNDRLVLVLPANARGVEVYARTDAGPVRRAALVPLPQAALSHLHIVENSAAAVSLDTAFVRPNEPRFSVRWRLTTGQPMVEALPTEGTGGLRVVADTRYVVVPDFFGDDMVFGPEATDLPWLGLPAENFFLNLVGKGDAMLMCVWRSRDQLARAILTSDGARRIISGCEIEWAKDQPVSVALLEGPGIWHEQSLPRELTTELQVKWKPPFPAKWRADAVRPDGFCGSSNVAENNGVSEPPVSQWREPRHFLSIRWTAAARRR